MTIPLVPDVYTHFTIGFANTPTLANSHGGFKNAPWARPKARLWTPPLSSSLIGTLLWHAYLVHTSNGTPVMASNAVMTRLVR